MGTWRPRAKADIARVIAANPGKTADELRKLCRETPLAKNYKRCSHPYKIWCSEMKTQLLPFRKMEPVDTFKLEDTK